MNYNELKAAYKQAERENKKTFMLNNWQILTSYAKSLLKQHELNYKGSNRAFSKATKRTGSKGSNSNS